MRAALVLATISIFSTSATAQASPLRQSGAAIPGYGAIHDLPGTAERPDAKLRYRVVFSITKAAASPDKPNPSLDKVARFLNLLAHDGVRPAKGSVVAIVHGAATPSIVRSPKTAAGTAPAANPNAELVERLQNAGVTVAVCSQALQAAGFGVGDVLPGVRVDDAALTTLANLQLRGYALIPD